MKTGGRVPRFGAGPLSERGSVILETAFAIPALVAVCGILLGVFAVGLTSLSLGDTAREAARSAARGTPLHEARMDAQRSSPRAEITITKSGSMITVDVQQTVSLPGVPGLSWTVHRIANTSWESFDDVGE